MAVAASVVHTNESIKELFVDRPIAVVYLKATLQEFDDPGDHAHMAPEPLACWHFVMALKHTVVWVR